MDKEYWSTIIYKQNALVSGNGATGKLFVYSSFSDPDPPDTCVFWHPGSGSTSQRYGSGYGSGSFYHHALNFTILRVKFGFKKCVSHWHLQVSDDNSRFRIQHSYPDPYPPVSGMDPRIRILTNVMAPEQWFIGNCSTTKSVSGSWKNPNKSL